MLFLSCDWRSAASLARIGCGEIRGSPRHDCPRRRRPLGARPRVAGRAFRRPSLGREATVTIGAARAGRGGRNTEFLLGFAIAAQGQSGVWAIAGDSDGIDGTEDAAGALVAPDSVARRRAAGMDA